jgi:hypothetical protein
MEWRLGGLIDSAGKDLQEHQLVFLKALAAAMSNRSRMTELRQFPEWVAAVDEDDAEGRKIEES